MNGVCLFYIKYAKQLQLSHLIFEYEKEAVFVPKGRKINEVTSSYKADTPTAKSDMSQKGKTELQKDID